MGRRDRPARGSDDRAGSACAGSNFFAPYVSGNAYVADFAKPTSTLRLPITVPAAGRYRL